VVLFDSHCTCTNCIAQLHTSRVKLTDWPRGEVGKGCGFHRRSRSKNIHYGNLFNCSDSCTFALHLFWITCGSRSVPDVCPLLLLPRHPGTGSIQSSQAATFRNVQQMSKSSICLRKRPCLPLKLRYTQKSSSFCDNGNDEADVSAH